MATWYSAETAGANSTPVVKANAINGVGSAVRRYTATVTLQSQASGDTIVLADLPAGVDFAFGVLTSTVSLGTATLSIGTASAAASYRAATTFTTADTPTLFGLTTAVQAVPLAATTRLIATVGTAALPASGTLVVDFYCAQP